MSSGGFLNAQLSKKTSIFGMKLWVLIGLAVGTFIFLILFMLSLWLGSRRKSRRILEKLPINQIPKVSKEIKEVKVDRKGINNPPQGDAISFTNQGNSSKKNSDKVLVLVGVKGFFDAKKSSPGVASLCEESLYSYYINFMWIQPL